MRSPAVVPALALASGVGVGVSTWFPSSHWSPGALGGLLLLGLGLAHLLGSSSRRCLVPLVICAIGIQHGAAARDAALYSSLRDVLDEAFGGYALTDSWSRSSASSSPVPWSPTSRGRGEATGRRDPVRLRARLLADAADARDFVSLRVESEAVRIDGHWTPVSGPVVVTVNGAAGAGRKGDWRAGRLIEVPVTFRRPTRYLNDGVDDFERDAALDGITLFASARSGLLVDAVTPGTRVEEAAAAVRAYVRDAITRFVGPHGGIPAAIVTAVLIGDRTGLPDEVRERLQAAGTYHVIAISGGNIAVLAALTIGIVGLCGLSHRVVAVVAIAVVVTYAQVASAGPSVWRATLMAILYFTARVFDHRTPPWHALAVAAALIAVVRPLDVRDTGFLLTFGATAGLLGAQRVVAAWLPSHRVAAWVVGSVAASVAAEAMVLPVSASAFSRVTGAGLVLNLIAVPAMAIVQVAGMAVLAMAHVPTMASAAGAVAAAAATVLVESARLVDLFPSFARRVPPPAVWLVATYYASLLAGWRAGSFRRRVGVRLAWLAAAVCIATGIDPVATRARVDRLRLTMFDVGQGESLLIESPEGKPLLVDTGGSPFGRGAFDIGGRVLAPALWARGIRRLGPLLVTHGDPDHMGGADSVIGDFRPTAIWWGIDVPRHQPSRELAAHAARARIPIAPRRTGQAFAVGGATIRVLNPPEPDWERQRVRNDDSVVIEVRYGDVALLLTGDISAELERAIAPRLTTARVRVLKVAHHGSRTSTAAELLDAWRPQIALISCGRGNTFGHPAAEVLARLASIGARVYRTDRDGQVTVTTDGQRVDVATFVDRGH